jgi:hypothetical protein
VREALKKKGWAAWSCDLLPTEISENHIQDDVLKHLNDGWDLMIAHPPCTYLSVAGLHWNAKRPGRSVLTEQALDFVKELLEAPIPRIALEDPVGCVNSQVRKPDQIINPWQFSHHERKRTYLWLKHLPLLVPTKIVEPEKPAFIDRSGKARYFVDRQPPSPDRWMIRSRTFPGIAGAMAQQWTDHILTARESPRIG